LQSTREDFKLIAAPLATTSTHSSSSSSCCSAVTAYRAFSFSLSTNVLALLLVPSSSPPGSPYPTSCTEFQARFHPPVLKFLSLRQSSLGPFAYYPLKPVLKRQQHQLRQNNIEANIHKLGTLLRRGLHSGLVYFTLPSTYYVTTDTTYIYR